jgi:3'-phosphoadenosine 5'-phosphosulfate sulfotransferase
MRSRRRSISASGAARRSATEQYGTDWNRTIEQLGAERKILEEKGLDSEDVSQRFGNVMPGQQPQQPAPAPPKSPND